MPLARRISLLGVAAILSVAAASAQSSLSPSISSPSLLAANESTSIAFQPAAEDSLGGASALPSPAAGGSGEGAGHEGHGWKYKASHDFAIDLGGGFNAPIGNDTPYITWGGNFTVGGGLHFSKYLSLLAEYQMIDDKLPGALVAAGGGTGGNAHIWSFTLDPVLDLFPKRTNSVYVTGGGGFYRKLTSFTVQECCDFYGYPVNIVTNHFSSNQGGLNFGGGITHRLGGVYGDGTMKLFAEARYLYLKTPSITETNGLGTTELIPVTFGLRW
jgi:hypothetical protein